MIKLYKSFKYDNGYDYIKTFNNKAEQDNYFNDLSYDILTDYDYIRENTTFNVELGLDYLTSQAINYLQFNNGYKDIYGFIVSKNYINDEVTELVFEVDVIQTYMFDFNIQKSFIERKVCNINEISDFDEGLDIGEHIIDSQHIAIQKDTNFFAMFNGIKEQQIILNNDGKPTAIYELPYATSKPTTIIDNIAYPLYFMPLLEQNQYRSATITPITPGGVDISGVVASAIKMIGKPYVWGGNYPPIGTDVGTDCSGLCQWAYNDYGGTYPNIGGRWTTFTMYPNSSDVDINFLTPGDVMFCSWDTSSMMDISTWTNGLPSHVTIIERVEFNDGVYTLNVIEALNENYPIKRSTYTYNSNKMKFGRLL